MSNIEQKDIPTLDDIIDQDKINDVEIDITENEENLDLFETAPETDVVESSIETGELEIDDIGIDDIKAETIETAMVEAEAFESEALTVDKDNINNSDTDTEIITHNTLHFSYEESYTDLDYQFNNQSKKTDNTPIEVDTQPEAVISIEPIALEQIVEGVVKQMMPDLEQQLRFLIQQSLEDKLPDEIIKLTTTEDSD